MDKLKWIGLGWLSMLALGLWWVYGRAKQKLAPKQEVEAAVERERADAVQVEPVPTDINEVKKRLREKGLLRD